MKQNPSIMAKIGTIFLTWRRYLQRDLLAHRITLKQLYVLRQLTKNEYLSPSEIADMLFCDRPTATVIINNLEREKLISRSKDPENAKQVRVTITPVGLEKLKQVDENENSNKNAFDPLACFDETELQQLNYLISKLNNHMKKIQ